MLKKGMLVSLLVLLFIVVAPPMRVSAQTGANPAACGKTVGGFLSFPTWYKYLSPRVVPATPEVIGNPDADPPVKPVQPRAAECKTNFVFPESIGKVLLAVFEIILRVGSLIAIGFVIYGGFQYIISQGEPERIKNARTTIINAIVGMVITIFASAIVSLIGNSIT